MIPYINYYLYVISVSSSSGAFLCLGTVYSSLVTLIASYLALLIPWYAVITRRSSFSFLPLVYSFLLKNNKILKKKLRNNIDNHYCNKYITIYLLHISVLLLIYTKLL